MKKLILLLIFILSLSDTEAQKTYVLVTAVSNYQDSQNDVTQTTKNAKSFAAKMKTQTQTENHLQSSPEYRPHHFLLCRTRWCG